MERESHNDVKTAYVHSFRDLMMILFRNIIPVLSVVIFLIHEGLSRRTWYLLSFLVLVLAFVPFFVRWEKGEGKNGREMVVIAVMSALAVVSRSIFYMLPQIKPMAAIVIITGAVLGVRAGFMTGAMAAFVSNFLFGQGPWTPWQMTAMGLVGALAGVIFYRKFNSSGTGASKKMTGALALYGGLAAGAIYGVIMDTATLFMYSDSYSLKLLITFYISGLPFNAAHGVATFLFILLLASVVSKRLMRLKMKYGIFADGG